MTEVAVHHQEPGRSGVLFVTWSFVGGRAREIAAALEGDFLVVHPKHLMGRRAAPMRWAVSSVVTAAQLLRRRPRSVIVTNPPIFPAVIVFTYGRLFRRPVIIDSHPGSFGRKGNRLAARFLPVHRWLARRVPGVLVTTDDWVREVDSWGGHGVVIHEAPPLWSVPPPRPITGRPTILFVGIFASDEPVDEVLVAASRLPDTDVVVTGDIATADPGLIASAPSNVRFVGYLGPEEYRAAVERADVILTITTEPTSVMRAAYEAVYAERPLVLSDWPNLRAIFPDGVFVQNDAGSIAEGLEQALESHERLRELAPSARQRQLRRWDEQIRELRAMIGAS